MKRLTYPLPSRASKQTGARAEVRSVWATKKCSTHKQNQFEVELVKELVSQRQPLFTSEPWGLEEALSAMGAGGWFDGEAEFASRATATFIRTWQVTRDLVMGAEHAL